jgi:SAM-dependent methyltransferase
MSRIEGMFGPNVWSEIKGRTVIDFGCGEGNEAIELASHGAGHVIGVDIRESVMDVGRKNARVAGLENIVFSADAGRKADVIFSIDAFEHFSEPDTILRLMASLLLPGGKVFIYFGPPWYHPKGGHLLSFFPWAHVLLPERFLCWWRTFYRSDGAKRFREVEGGLNQMSIRQFENIVKASPFCTAVLSGRGFSRAEGLDEGKP